MKVRGVRGTITSMRNKFFEEIAEGKTKEMQGLVIALAEATPVETGVAQAGWKVENGDRVTNHVEYISELNKGSSEQAPRYFVEMTILARGLLPAGVLARDV